MRGERVSPAMLEGDLTVEPGDVVRFVFTVRNAGSEVVDLEYPDSCHADFAVFDGDERCWRWSDGRAFMQVIERETLDPGETTTYEGEWPSPNPGRFTARAELRTRERTCEAEREFSV